MYLSLLSQKGDIGGFYFEWMLVFWELFLIQISCLFVFSLSTSYLHVPYFFALTFHVCIILFKSRCFFHFVTKESVNTLSAFVSLSSSSFRLLSRLIVSFLLLLSTSCLFPVVRSLSSPPYLPIPIFSYILSSQFILSHLISTHVTSHHLISLNLFQLISSHLATAHVTSSHLTSRHLVSFLSLSLFFLSSCPSPSHRLSLPLPLPHFPSKIRSWNWFPYLTFIFFILALSALHFSHSSPRQIWILKEAFALKFFTASPQYFVKRKKEKKHGRCVWLSAVFYLFVCCFWVSHANGKYDLFV